MAPIKAQPLRQCIGTAERFFSDRNARVCVAELTGGTSLGGRLDELTGKSILVATESQVAAALAFIELDGVARRLAILPPGSDPDHLAAIVAGAGIEAIVVDAASAASDVFALPLRVICSAEITPVAKIPAPGRATEWVMLTSGTTGVPKMAVHSIAGLTAPIRPIRDDGPVVWGTFYDIRRYGGLQIFLRALLGGTSLVLSSAGEPIAGHLERLANAGITHLTGTPSHWRRALMSPAIRSIAPRYVRLSGEIADQAILDALRAAFPQASVGHAYASTEAGVAFAVDDGVAGFPAPYIGASRDGVVMKVEDGSLRIRSPRAASRYLGSAAVLTDRDGFIDSGDMVELRGDRYVFTGRRGGIINIGGHKVHPEEVEAVINRHPQVRMSRVHGKRNPLTGAVVVADVVLKSDRGGKLGAVKGDILKFCRDALPLHKVPASISIVPALDVAATGKLARRHG